MIFPSKSQHRVILFITSFYTVLFAIFLIYGDNSTTAAAQNQLGNALSGYYSLSTCGSVYGNFWSGDQLDNEPIGGLGNQQLSFRWRSEYTEEITHFRWHNNFNYSREGYHAGDGGTIRLELQTDDGRGFPSGDVRASHVISGLANAENPVYFPKIAWDEPVRVAAGEVYHVLFKNVHDDPEGNYISINTLHQINESQRQKCLSDSDLALLYLTDTSDWAVLGKRSPSHEFYFRDGRTQGLGYIHTWSSTTGQIKYIEGQNKIREIFTVAAGPINVTDISVRVSRNGQTFAETVEHPLTAHLVDITNNNTEISSCILPQDAIADGCSDGCLNAGQIEKVSFTYATCDWSDGPISLLDGNSYAVELSAPPNVPYTSFVMQQGSNYGYSSSSYFSDGHAEFTTDGGATWELWTNWNNGPNNRRDVDLQFFMSTPSTSSLQIQNNADCNDDLTVIDAQLILQYVVGSSDDADGCLIADNNIGSNAVSGDVNGDGQIDAVDALFILQCEANLSNSFCPENGLVVSAVDLSSNAFINVLLQQNGKSLSVALYSDGITAGTFEVSYDNAQGQFLDCTLFGAGACNEVRPGIVQFSFANAQVSSAEQPIGQLMFEGEDVTISDVQVIKLVDMAGHELTYTVDITQIDLENQIFIPFIDY